MMIRINPFPLGKNFAVSFVDDTDLSTRENTEPVYELLNRYGVKGTKTVWMNRQKRTSAFNEHSERVLDSILDNGATLEDQHYRDFILRLREMGFEIALHNVAAGNSYRSEILEGVEAFKTLFGTYPKINIFHEKNRENLYAGYNKLDLWPLKILEKITDNSDYQGHVEGSKYYWGDVAKDKIKYMRLPFHTIAEVNTWKVNPNMPFHDPKRPSVNYWFASSDGADCMRFNKLLSDKNIRKLEKENGVCLIYTHFAKGFCRKESGRYTMNRDFVNTIANLASYKNAWFPTASELLDRLLACKDISAEQSNYDITIRNHGEVDVDDLVLRISFDIRLSGKALNSEIHDNKTVVISKIPANGCVVVKCNKKQDGRLVENKERNISRRERIGIELANYYGLLSQAIANMW